MGPDENKNNFNGGVNLNPPNSIAPNSTPILTTTSTPPQSSALNPTLVSIPNPTLDPTPNPRAQFTAGNRLGMRQSRKFSAKEELDRISNDLNLNSANAAPTGTNNIAFSGAALGVVKPKTGSTKKPLIFALIGITVVAVAGLAFALTIMGKASDRNDLGKRELFSAFNSYVSHYLGNEVDFSKSYTVSDIYNVDNAIKNNDHEFFETAEKNFKSLVDSTNNVSSEILKKQIDQYKKIFDFAYGYGTSVIPTEKAIFKKYNEVGKDGAVSYIKNSYAKILNVDFQDSNESVLSEINYYTELISFYDLYKINGCNSSSDINNDKCLVSKIGRKPLVELANSLAQKNKKRTNLLKYVGYSKESLWEINNLIKQVGYE